MATRGNGATTVSATMIFASMVIIAYLEFVSSFSSFSNYILLKRDLYLLIILLLQVGIPIFVTGGIGGVHRHGENSKFTQKAFCLDIFACICFCLETDGTYLV